jgi:hypothetical protein
MRTQDEIVARYLERKPEDPFANEVDIYLSFMDYSHAKPFIKDTVTEEEWEENYPVTDPRKEMIAYMPFAWDKANNCRGLSAMRSLQHYQAWLWLDDDEKIWPTLEEYQHYGKEHLVTICEYLGLDSKQWDDGYRVNSESELDRLRYPEEF